MIGSSSFGGGAPQVFKSDAGGGGGIQKGEHARLSAFIGAIAVADLVKTTLGPKGMDKMLTSSGPGAQNVTVTNDGATILKKIPVDNPSAKILVNISMTQDDEVGDGTTSVVVLAGELLREAERLTAQKLHPQTIIRGWRNALKSAQEALRSRASDNSGNASKFRRDLLNITRTTLSSKIVTAELDFFANLCVDAVLRLKGSIDLDMITIVKKPGGSMRDSFLDNGFILDKSFGLGQPTRYENPRILIANTPMDTDKIKIWGARVKVHSMSEVAEIEAAEKAKMKMKVDKILAHKPNLFINRQLIYDYPEQLFTDADVGSIEHADFEGIERLARALGAEIMSVFDKVETTGDEKSAAAGDDGDGNDGGDEKKENPDESGAAAASSEAAASQSGGIGGGSGASTSEQTGDGAASTEADSSTAATGDPATSEAPSGGSPEKGSDEKKEDGSGGGSSSSGKGGGKSRESSPQKRGRHSPGKKGRRGRKDAYSRFNQLGTCKVVEEVMIGEDTVIRFSGVERGEACTIVLRGASIHLLDEMERSIHDALCILTQTIKESRIVYGGGASEMLMADAVDRLAATTRGKQALAIDAFARALRCIPTILADNAGYDAAEIVTNLRAEHAQGNFWMGIDINRGKVGDMRKLGVTEAFKSKNQSLVSAHEAAEMILRVDDIVVNNPRARAPPGAGGH